MSIVPCKFQTNTPRIGSDRSGNIFFASPVFVFVVQNHRQHNCGRLLCTETLMLGEAHSLIDTDFRDIIQRILKLKLVEIYVLRFRCASFCPLPFAPPCFGNNRILTFRIRFCVEDRECRSITSYVRIFKLRSAGDVFVIMKVAQLKFFVFVFVGTGDDHLEWFHRSHSVCHVFLSTLGPSRLVRSYSCRFLCGKCAFRISTRTRAILI